MRVCIFVRMPQVAVIAAGCVFFFGGMHQGSAAVNLWEDAVDGAWGTSEKWSEGLPQSHHDVSIAQPGNYTVTVDDVTANNALGMVVTGITVGASSGLPSLLIDYTNTARTLMVGAGDNGNIGVAIAAESQGLFSVATGQVSAARLHLGAGQGGNGTAQVAGGSVALRSMSTGAGNEWLRLGPDAGSTGSLVMTGGQISGPFDRGGTYGHIGGAGYGELIISNGLFMTGGFGLGVGASSGIGELKLYGGYFRHGNDGGTKYMEVGSGANSEGFILIDGGNLIVTNNAVLTFGVRAGSRGIATISNGILNTVSGSLYFGSRADSYGEMNVVGGTNLCTRPWIGAGSAALGGGEGVVNVTSNGYMASVGGWTSLASGPGSRGTLNVSGNGICEIGGFGMLMGDGDGGWAELNVAGGECRVISTLHLRSGAINVSGGTFSSGTTYLGTTGGTGSAKTGTVSIAGGTVTFGSTTVGAAGLPGFLRIKGTEPVDVTINSLTATTEDSTLEFILDYDGVTPIAVNNALTVNADTKLVIDCSTYFLLNGLEVPLINYGSMSGVFDTANITIIYTGSSTVSVDQGTGISDSLTLLFELPPAGTFIMIR